MIVVMKVETAWSWNPQGMQVQLQTILNATKKKHGVSCVTSESQKIHWPLHESHLGAKI